MSSCAVCSESGLFKAPTALPCGHIYCHNCIAKATHSSTSLSTTVCPICRAPFTIDHVAAVDVDTVPQLLQHYFLPPRRDFFDAPALPPSRPHFPFNSSLPLSPPQTLSLKAALTQANSHALRKICLAWRQRANAPVPASVELTDLIRVAQEQERTRQEEREEFFRRCEILLKQFSASHAQLSWCVL
ncbi:hypothetical protein BV25DRAFT_1133641 [Artomyces pyxidatus]|uniref:Uncharacterized protein n=1 Tax=Artomyces pyxidatus TaxID=48021 RepID=A0ACB8SSB5_9AGAM|nr:hypothetical protein BV25DRAFT_1133641 [Artomyces pyxidatus]